MDYIKTAQDTFSNNFNCAQAVLSSFCDELGLDIHTALKISSGFGGGMRCGEVCGAVTGALMVLGLKYGQSSSDDLESKSNCNKKACEFIASFKEINNSIICKDLLGYDMSIAADAEKLKSLNLFKTVCPKMIADAVKITESMIF